MKRFRFEGVIATPWFPAPEVVEALIRGLIESSRHLNVSELRVSDEEIIGPPAPVDLVREDGSIVRLTNGQVTA